MCISLTLEACIYAVYVKTKSFTLVSCKGASCKLRDAFAFLSCKVEEIIGHPFPLFRRTNKKMNM
jgi:hypothetical protein